MKKIVIIGCGYVGINYLNLLATLDNIYLDITLIDIDKSKLVGEILDVSQGIVTKNSNINIKIGDYDDCDDADIIVITAGVKQSLNSRMDDLEAANKIICDISFKIKETNFSGIILVASNPLDVMTQLVSHYTNFSYNKVIGTGTMLDTLRLKYLISKKINVRVNDINVYALGEHGDSQFVAWSNANIGLQNLSCFLTDDEKDELAYETMMMGRTIIKSKGYTSFGVASCLLNLTLAIINDLKCVYPVSNYNSTYDVYLSTPAIIGKNGIEKVVDIKLTTLEEDKFKKSGEIIGKAISSVLPDEIY